MPRKATSRTEEVGERVRAVDRRRKEVRAWESAQARGSVNQDREKGGFSGETVVLVVVLGKTGRCWVRAEVSGTVSTVEEAGGAEGRDEGVADGVLTWEMRRGRKRFVASAVTAKSVMAKVPWRTASGWRLMGIWRRGG